METLEKLDYRARLAKTDKLLEEARTLLLSQGVTLDLTTEWVTIKEYCKRFDIANTQTVTNWIKRGIIPEEDIHVIPEFNDIRMIRAKKYQAQ